MRIEPEKGSQEAVKDVLGLRGCESTHRPISLL